MFVKVLLPRAGVLKAREAYFANLAHTDILKPSKFNEEGIFDDAKPPTDYPWIGASQDALERAAVAAQFVDTTARAAHKGVVLERGGKWSHATPRSTDQNTTYDYLSSRFYTCVL